MAYELPFLPYDHHRLEPYIDEETTHLTFRFRTARSFHRSGSRASRWVPGSAQAMHRSCSADRQLRAGKCGMRVCEPVGSRSHSRLRSSIQEIGA